MRFDLTKAYLIRSDGFVNEIAPENGTDFGLEELYRHLDCDTIQVIWPMPGTLMILDENSKSKRPYRINQIATALTRDVLAHDDLIVGNAVLCPDSMMV